MEKKKKYAEIQEQAPKFLSEDEEFWESSRVPPRIKTKYGVNDFARLEASVIYRAE